MLTQLMNSLESWNIKPNRTQLLRFALSLVLGVLLWGWVTQLQDPYTERRFQDLPILTDAIQDELLVVSALPAATVDLDGPRSRVGHINRNDIQVTIDTSDISGPGTYQVDVLASAPDVSSVEVSPREITIQVDRRVSEVFPLTVANASDEDDLLAIDGIEPEVSQVTVSGAESVVSRVDQVILPVTLDQNVDDFDTSFAPYAIDAAGQRISDVEILPQTVSTHVTVDSRGKSVSVITNVTGTPAEGYAVQQRRAFPDTIIIDGPEELLNDLLFVNTEPVDISGATQSISASVQITGLPEGVTIVEPEDGMVEVGVAIEDTTASTQPLSDLPVQVVGLDDGLAATVDPTTVSIQVSAPLSLLQTMQPEDISIFVNVEGLGPGMHILEPIITVPQGATWSGVNPASVTVTISQAPTASPVAGTPPTAAETG